MRRALLVMAACACPWVSAAITAQVRTGPFPPGQGRGAGGPVRAIPPDQLGMMSIEPLDAERAVTGSPYTAQAVTVTTQLLADGNRIERRTTASIARDSNGRVRREQEGLALGGLMVDGRLVTISDPGARTHLTLDAQRQVAFLVRTTRLGAPAFPAAPPPAGVGDARTESLGERTIEGVRAEGSRTTMTIPAQAIGNQAPITIVSERWFSRDLQTVVLTRRTDPRFGETLYRLSNVVRAEPPAALFSIPTNYRVEEQALPQPVRTIR
jgi:hypothetical protein